MRYLSISSGSQGHPSLAITHINMWDCSVLYVLYCLCSCNMVLSALQLASVVRQRKDLRFSYCYPDVFLMPGMTQIWQQWGQIQKNKVTSTQLNLQNKLFGIYIILPFNGVWTARPRGMTLFRGAISFNHSIRLGLHHAHLPDWGSLGQARPTLSSVYDGVWHWSLWKCIPSMAVGPIHHHHCIQSLCPVY